jgi:hypothetical protein
MTMYQNESIKTITNLLDEMDNDVFLEKYNSFEKHLGPTIEKFNVRVPYGSFKKYSSETDYPQNLSREDYKITIPTFQGENQFYCANDDQYTEVLAA